MVKLIFTLLFGLSMSCSAQSWNPASAPVWLVGSLKEIDNKLYMCGIDSVTSPNGYNYISVFDGIHYDTLLGKCYMGTVEAFEKYNGILYVAGNFKHIGQPIANPNANGIHLLARWNGMYFDSLGAFPLINSGEVNSIISYNNELYIGGNFLNGAGQGINHIMKYNGNSFSDVGGGIIGNFTEVFDMVHYNGELIVAGSFYSAGGISVNNIARWNGSQWLSMGDGLGPYVFSLTVDTINNILYAGGNIGYSGSTVVNKVAYWDGQNWQQVGNGLPNQASPLSLCMYKNALYVGTGNTWQTSQIRMHKWDGQNWYPLQSTPTDGNIIELCEFQNLLYAGGSFNEIDSNCCFNGIAYYLDSTIVGFDESDLFGDNIIIYPNPAKDKVTIGFHESTSEILEISIMDIAGKLLGSEHVKIGEQYVNIALPNNICSGTYICKFSLCNKTFIKKIVVN